MKKRFTISLLSTLLACGTQESNPIIGSWSQCLRDGTYKEFKISDHYTTTSVSNFPEHDYDDGISFYKSFMQDSLLIITTGINVDLMNGPETLRVKLKSYDKIILENEFGISELTRLKDEIPDIDSTMPELWSKLYRVNFLKELN